MKKLIDLRLIVFSVFVAGLMFSCEDEINPNEKMNNRIQGSWDVDSWTIDGVEYIDYLISSFEMEFEKETSSGGETDWTLINIEGAVTKIDGDYEISNDGMTIEIDGDDMNISFRGDILELSGNVGGERWEIEATQ